MSQLICHITKKPLSPSQSYKADLLRDHLFEKIQSEHPDFTKDSYISVDELNKYRKDYLQNLIEEETGEFEKLENEVVDAITNNKILSENIEDDIEEQLTIGQRLADHIADFGGSWIFIIAFFTFIFLWMGLNIWYLSGQSFDPYPFILLNLILSCLAAIQAPIIMMSQNRQEQKDRQRSEHDYKVNLKAELEIKLLHEKIDHLISHQNRKLLEIQAIQTDFLEDILKKANHQK